MNQSIRWVFGCVVVAIALSSPFTAFAEGLPSTLKPVRTIGMDEYRTLVDQPGTALIVDVREPQEFAAGHVPGVINIPRGLIDSQIWDYVGAPEKADKDRPIVLQCQSGKRATLAAQTLGELGFTRTTAVIMNLNDWQKAGNPFTK